MQKAPTENEIREYLRTKQPLGFGGSATITDIDPKPVSGHFNFLVEQNENSAVLRMKGPEWGEPRQGVIDEYRILEHVAPYGVAPQPLMRDEEGIREEPLLFEEYVRGDLFSKLPETEQQKHMPEVAELIARINAIPVANGLPYQEPITSYLNRPQVWRERLAVVKRVSPEWYERAAALLPAAETMLRRFESVLAETLSEHGNAFVFESAHAGHCIMTEDGPRFLNWEQVSYGDPSFTLAVFLASLHNRDDFEDVKKAMIATYRTSRDVSNLEALVEQRLAEREVSNLVWALWSQAKNSKQISNAPEERLRRAENLLTPFSGE